MILVLSNRADMLAQKYSNNAYKFTKNCSVVVRYKSIFF